MTMSTLDEQPLAAADCSMWCMHSSDAYDEHFLRFVEITVVLRLEVDATEDVMGS